MKTEGARGCGRHAHAFLRRRRGAAPGTPNPGHFTVPMYRELQTRLGLRSVIVVQPNAYRDDNRVTLER